MRIEANIFPVFEPKKTDGPHLEAHFRTADEMERYFAEAPLGQNIVVTLGKAEIDMGTEEALIIVEDYQFIVTRRFIANGELHVGGANGEVLNVYTFISNFKHFLKSQIDLRDGTA